MLNETKRFSLSPNQASITRSAKNAETPSNSRLTFPKAHIQQLSEIEPISIRPHAIKDSFSSNMSKSAFAHKHSVQFSGKYQDYPKLNLVPNCNIQRESFNWAKKERVNAPNSNLTLSDFNKSNFRKSCFDHSILKGTIFSNSQLADASFKGVTCGQATYEDMCANTTFDYADLSGADFTGAQFQEKTSFRNASLFAANFSNTDLTKVDFENALYNDVTTFPENFNPQANGMIYIPYGSGLDLAGKDLQRVKLRLNDITDSNFDNGILKRADLRHNHFKNCSFKENHMSRAYLKSATIEDCNFRKAKLKQVNFDDAELKNVDMRDADFRGAVLTWKTADNVNLHGAGYNKDTIFHRGFDPNQHGMVWDPRPTNRHPKQYDK